MIHGPLTSLLALATDADVVAPAAAHATQPHELADLPALVVGRRVVDDLMLSEGGAPMRAGVGLDLFLVTAQAGGSEGASSTLSALISAICDPDRSNWRLTGRIQQFEANWGRKEVFISRLVVSRNVRL